MLLRLQVSCATMLTDFMIERHLQGVDAATSLPGSQLLHHGLLNPAYLLLHLKVHDGQPVLLQARKTQLWDSCIVCWQWACPPLRGAWAWRACGGMMA